MRIVHYGNRGEIIDGNYVLHCLTGSNYVFNCNPVKTMTGVNWSWQDAATNPR